LIKHGAGCGEVGLAHADAHVLQHRAPRQESWFLKHHDRASAARHAAAFRCFEPGENAQERALPGATATDDGDELARLNLEVDVAQDAATAELEVDRIEAQLGAASMRMRSGHQSAAIRCDFGCHGKSRVSSARAATSVSLPIRAHNTIVSTSTSICMNSRAFMAT
jgi:hypothetical protein